MGETTMTKAHSYADLVTEWETLLSGLAGQPSLAGLTNQPKVEAALARVKGLLFQQAERQAAKQVTSKDLFAAAAEGREATQELKVEIRGRLGARAEQLVQFKVMPVRTTPSRVRSSKRKSKGKAGNTTPTTPTGGSNPPTAA
jgi:hypothetical protein